MPNKFKASPSKERQADAFSTSTYFNFCQFKAYDCTCCYLGLAKSDENPSSDAHHFVLLSVRRPVFVSQAYRILLQRHLFTSVYMERRNLTMSIQIRNLVFFKRLRVAFFVHHPTFPHLVRACFCHCARRKGNTVNISDNNESNRQTKADEEARANHAVRVCLGFISMLYKISMIAPAAAPALNAIIFRNNACTSSVHPLLPRVQQLLGLYSTATN